MRPTHLGRKKAEQRLEIPQRRCGRDNEALMEEHGKKLVADLPVCGEKGCDVCDSVGSVA